MMDAGLFARMLSDKSIIDLKKLGYKYPQADMKEFVALLVSGFYKTLPLKDFHGGNLVYLESVAGSLVSSQAVVDSPEQRPALWQESDGGGDHLHLFH